MEGISHEAMSLAGHLKLKNLIVFFDNNKISIDGSTTLSVSDNFKKDLKDMVGAFKKSMAIMRDKFQKQLVKLQNLKNQALYLAKQLLVMVHQINLEKLLHGSPLGEDEISLVRKKLKWTSPPFVVPNQILQTWREIGKKGKSLEEKWNEDLNKKIQKLSLI